MNSMALIFFVLSILVVLVGSLQLVGMSIEAAKILSMTFLILGILTYVKSLTSERKNIIH